MKFEKGDTVKRIKCNFEDCIIGEEYIVKEFRGDHIEIEGHGSRGYDTRCFELVKSVNKEPELSIW